MTRPNILVFMTDDHAQWAAGCYGNREIVSPTMDHLARRGARFDHAFTPSPVCSPARASFFTGRIPSRHGIHDYLQAQGETARLHPALDGQTTLGPRLQQSGYETALVGKWHCTEPWSPQPGFDVWFSSKKGTFATFGEQVFYEGDQEVTWHGHPSLPVTDRAVRFLNERDPQKPFFLFVGYVDTHTPHNSQPQRLLDLYADATFEDIPDEQENPVHGKFRLYQAPKDAPDIRRAMLADIVGERDGPLAAARPRVRAADEDLVATAQVRERVPQRADETVEDGLAAGERPDGKGAMERRVLGDRRRRGRSESVGRSGDQRVEAPLHVGPLVGHWVFSRLTPPGRTLAPWPRR